MNEQFVGFGRLEDLINAMQKDKPVNVECITQQAPSRQYGGLIFSTDVICTSQVQDKEVLYHYYVTGQYQTLFGNTLSHDDGKSIAERSGSGYQLVLEILKQAGFETRRALIAFPRELKLLEGNTSLLHYNKDADRFERAETGVPA